MEEELKSLLSKLSYQQRKESEGFFASSSPSSKRPMKPNTKGKPSEPKGTRLGHAGSGRKSHEQGTEDRMVYVESPDALCPD